MKMLGTFKIDKSNFGHALEAFIIAILIMAGCVGIIGLGWLSYSAPKGFLLDSTLALAWYIGREKRDCETGLKLSAGSPKAWLLMWIRWQNLLELVGPASPWHRLGWRPRFLKSRDPAAAVRSGSRPLSGGGLGVSES